jgi:hypothetical protein
LIKIKDQRTLEIVSAELIKVKNQRTLKITQKTQTHNKKFKTKTREISI